MTAAQAVVSRPGGAVPASGNGGDWLADLAGVWVERWLAHGGWLIVDANCDAVSMGVAMRNHPWRSKNPRGRRLWHDGWKVGRWRELHEMAGYVPGLCAAIVHHVALNGYRDPSGCTSMTFSAEDAGVV